MTVKQNLGSNLESLHKTINERKTVGNLEGSYTAKILNKGSDYIAQKVGEEAVEMIIAATKRSKDETISESADVLYHMMVLWVSLGISPLEVSEELENRKAYSGIEEKNSR
ncbi:MAG: phosphoribosyl-ATP diphosphatase [Alphaproteobacteria bacterium]|nr:phosphoribosyl-ATP diphosphatase [Alphaproteobacteria bacterium]|tara:strand:+ start:5616 stop:5948 length:333 start_codon:yes stop_codon:yes gene_type:complete